jgi:hypothetical protein
MGDAEMKRRAKQENKLQDEVLIDLFERGLTQAQVEDRQRLAPGTIAEWLTDPDFKFRMWLRMDAAWWQARIVVAQQAVKAARNLVDLIDSEKEEIRRKACMDVIKAQPTRAETPTIPEEPTLPPGVSEKTAHRILEVLAEADEEEDE